jgi:Fe-S cluster assembly protein SufD
MLDVMEEKDQYLASFAQLEKELARTGPARLHGIRQAAIERYQELGLPTLHDEEWRFTNLAPLAQTRFCLARPGVGASASFKAMPLPADGHRLVFINGGYAHELSAPPPGLAFAGSLASALAAPTEAVTHHLARYAAFEEHAFTALNTALFRDGALLVIPEETVVEDPIHIIFHSMDSAGPIVTHPRCLIVIGRHSEITLVESYTGAADGAYFTNAVTEIVVGEGASVDHYKLQEESLRAFHVATLQVQQERSSKFSSHFISFGGRLVRNEVNAVLAAPGIESTLNGLYMGAGTQHIDNHTVIDHAQPHCTSHELYKGILKDQAKGVFNGKIFVRQDAQKTDAKQTNQTLLLSDDATINTKPQLEIYADDVKCTHGATVGQLSEDALFYLCSRGIGKDAARALLTYAFANDVVGRIKVGSVRRRLEETLLAAQGLPPEAGTEAD